MDDFHSYRSQGKRPLEEPVSCRTMDPVRYTVPSDRRVQLPCSRWWIDYDKFANKLRCMILN